MARFLCVIIALNGTISLFMLKGQDMVEYQSNPDLACVRAEIGKAILIFYLYLTTTTIILIKNQ